MNEKPENPKLTAFTNPGADPVTLRDLFAATAMHAIVSNWPTVVQDVPVDWSYKIADAMFKQRGEKP